MLPLEQLWVGALSELLTSLNDDKGWGWRPIQWKLPHSWPRKRVEQQQQWVDRRQIVLVGLAVGIHHGGLVPLMGEAILLQVTFLPAVSAGSVRVSQWRWRSGLNYCSCSAIVVLGSGITIDRKLIKLLVRQIFPDNLLGPFFLQLCLDGGNVVEPFMVILDGLQAAGNLDAFGERIFGRLKHLVADAIL